MTNENGKEDINDVVMVINIIAGVAWHFKIKSHHQKGYFTTKRHTLIVVSLRRKYTYKQTTRRIIHDDMVLHVKWSLHDIAVPEKLTVPSDGKKSF